MTVFGLGEVLGAFFIGYLIDHFGSRSCSLVNVALVMITTVFMLEFLFINEYNVLTFVTTFMWGF